MDGLGWRGCYFAHFCLNGQSPELLLDARWLTGIFHSVGRVNLCVEHSKLRRTGGGAGSTLGKY